MSAAVVARLADSYTDFERTLKSHTRRSWAIVAVTALVALVVFALLAPTGLPIGDSPLYAEDIRDGSLEHAPRHIAYFVTAIGFTRVVPLPVDHAMNLMSAVFGALAVGLAGSIAYTLTGRWPAIVGSGACVAAPYVFASNATSAEVYVLQLALFLLCVQSALWGRVWLTAAAFAAAFLVTPSTVLALPLLVGLRPRLRFAGVWLAIAVGVVFSAFVVASVTGAIEPRVLLDMAPGNMTATQALAKEGRELASFALAAIPIAVGAWVLARSRRHRLLLAGIMLTGLVQLVVGERYSDVPVQLPLYGMLGVLGGIGVARIWETRRDTLTGPVAASVLLAAVLAVSASTTYRAVATESATTDGLQDLILAVGDSASPGDLILAPSALHTLGSYYLAEKDGLIWVPEEMYVGGAGADAQEQARAELDGAMSRDSHVWMLSATDPAGFEAPLRARGYALEPFRTIYVARPVADGVQTK